ncbi:MAG: ribosomal RNA small subunit methyltransferase A [Synergistaceae bacterium]|nr:ribosomal RNA small subunit methyltransferase A [Synergistaceae bacterium]
MIKTLKRFGQNFLIDKNILAFIITRAGLSESDCILEIGAGEGVLTREILAKKVKCLHTIEIDERLKPSLEEIAVNNPALNLHWGDAVKFDYDSLRPFPNKVVANIPYNITTPLIRELIKYPEIKYYLLMLQKESAERITAKPDTKARYPLGVIIESMGRAEIVHRVSRNCFKPVPKVDSALVEIVINKNFELARDNLFSDLLHKGFAHRRKTLLNNLRGFMNIEDWREILKDSASLRAEDLTCEKWLEIYRDLTAHIIPILCS